MQRGPALRPTECDGSVSIGARCDGQVKNRQGLVGAPGDQFVRPRNTCQTHVQYNVFCPSYAYIRLSRPTHIFLPPLALATYEAEESVGHVSRSIRRVTSHHCLRSQCVGPDPSEIRDASATFRRISAKRHGRPNRWVKTHALQQLFNEVPGLSGIIHSDVVILYHQIWIDPTGLVEGRGDSLIKIHLHPPHLGKNTSAWETRISVIKMSSRIEVQNPLVLVPLGLLLDEVFLLDDGLVLIACEHTGVQSLTIHAMWGKTFTPSGRSFDRCVID